MITTTQQEGEGRAETPKRSLTQDVAQRVLKYIRDNGLSDGDRLPPVRALAERLAVAPPTLREALHRLAVTQAIDMRHGSGVYVTDQVERLLFANPHTAPIDAGRFVDLLETRAILEPELAALATTHGTLAQMHKLQATLDEAATMLEGSNEGLFRANMGFHQGIAAMSGNQVASSVIDSLVDIYAHEQHQILLLFDHRRDLDEHLQILACIRTGDADDARDHMRTHLRGVRDAVVAAAKRQPT